MSTDEGRRLQELRRSGAAGKHKDKRDQRKDRRTREREAKDREREAG